MRSGSRRQLVRRSSRAASWSSARGAGGHPGPRRARDGPAATLSASPLFARPPIQPIEEAQAELEEDWGDPKWTIFVAEHEGRVVGSSIGCALEISSGHAPMMRPARAGFLGFAAVLPDARGLGAGRALGEAVLAWSRDAGYDWAATDWRSTNLEAERTWREPRLPARPSGGCTAASADRRRSVRAPRLSRAPRAARSGTPGRVAGLDPGADRVAREQLVDDHRRRPDDAREAAQRRPLDEQVARRERERAAVDRLADRGEERCPGCWRRRRR